MEKNIIEKFTYPEVETFIKKFLSKYAKQLECKLYKNEETVLYEGSHTAKIYIVNEGIFRIGRTQNMEKETTIAFCKKYFVLAPISIISPNFPSLYEIRSIKNSISKQNTIYEVSIEKLNELAENDDTLKGMLQFMVYDNLVTLLKLFDTFRHNRNMKDLIYELYFSKHWLLNSGISEHYIADSLSISENFLRRTLNEIKYKRDEERFEKIKTKLNI